MRLFAMICTALVGVAVLIGGVIAFFEKKEKKWVKCDSIEDVCFI